MKIRLNGEAFETEAETLLDLVQALGYAEAERIATAVDGVFVPRSARAGRQLTNGCEVEIVAPRQGG